MDAEAHAEQLREQGFTVFEGLYEREWVEGIRADIESIHAAAGRPACHAAQTRELIEGVYLCAAGMAVPGLLLNKPRWAGCTVKPEVVDTLRAYLGADMVLEVAGCVVSDRSRPFFAWHNHVGGNDDGMYRSSGNWPDVDRPRRVMTLTYLQDLDDDHGPLLVHERRVGQPTGPIHDPDMLDWPDQLELRVPAGTMVIIDECTWHAVRPLRTDALRMFVGLAYRARDTEVGGWAHDRVHELAQLDEASELLRSVICAPTSPSAQ